MQAECDLIYKAKKERNKMSVKNKLEMGMNWENEVPDGSWCAWL